MAGCMLNIVGADFGELSRVASSRENKKPGLVNKAGFLNDNSV